MPLEGSRGRRQLLPARYGPTKARRAVSLRLGVAGRRTVIASGSPSGPSMRLAALDPCTGGRMIVTLSRDESLRRLRPIRGA